MSALGHKQTFCDAEAMSALPPKADIRSKNVDPDQHGLISAGVHSFNAARSMAT
jgi:hypothetical protein